MNFKGVLVIFIIQNFTMGLLKVETIKTSHGLFIYTNTHKLPSVWELPEQFWKTRNHSYLFLLVRRRKAKGCWKLPKGVWFLCICKSFDPMLTVDYLPYFSGLPQTVSEMERFRHTRLPAFWKKSTLGANQSIFFFSGRIWR